MANIFDLIPVSVNAGKLDNQLACCNNASSKYGLTLTRQDMTALEAQHIELLQRTERVEFGTSTVVQLVEGFASSAYLQQSEYAACLEDLQEVFYELREQAGADVFDEEIIDGMRLLFDGDAGGSVEMLASLSLDDIIEAYDTRTGSLEERQREIIDYEGNALESTVPGAFMTAEDFGISPEYAARLDQFMRNSTGMGTGASTNANAQPTVEDLANTQLTGPDGQVYTWNPDEWEDNEQAPGWDGERWTDDF